MPIPRPTKSLFFPKPSREQREGVLIDPVSYTQGIRETLDQYELGFNEADGTSDAALFLVLSTQLGTNAHKIYEFSGLPIAQCRQFATNARINRIWRGHRVISEPWTDDESGQIRFILDVLCVVGEAVASGWDLEGGPMYNPSRHREGD